MVSIVCYRNGSCVPVGLLEQCVAHGVNISFFNGGPVPENSIGLILGTSTTCEAFIAACSEKHVPVLVTAFPPTGFTPDTRVGTILIFAPSYQGPGKGQIQLDACRNILQAREFLEPRIYTLDEIAGLLPA